MTADEAALLADILDFPDEDAPRLRWADWQEEYGSAERAEFVRVQVELARMPACESPHGHDDRDSCDVCERYRAGQTRVNDLLAGDHGRNWRHWIGPAKHLIPAGAYYYDHVDLSRGFVDGVTCPASLWLAHADGLLACQPVREVTMTDLRSGFAGWGEYRSLRDDAKRYQIRAVATVHWKCECACGEIVVVSGRRLRAGRTRSCGCLRREVSRARGDVVIAQNRPSRGPWKAMIGRCANPKNKVYRFYGGRGITVCDRWLNSFAAFVEDMGPRPSGKHSIDRIDTNGNYEPGNCRWATQQEQLRNKRNNHNLTHAGRTMCVTAWAEEYGIDARRLFTMVERHGPDGVFLVLAK